MYSHFTVTNTECAVCTNETLKTLGKLQGVFGAEIDRISGDILVNHTDEVSREDISQTLNELGYKEEKREEVNYEQLFNEIN